MEFKFGAVVGVRPLEEVLALGVRKKSTWGREDQLFVQQNNERFRYDVSSLKKICKAGRAEVVGTIQHRGLVCIKYKEDEASISVWVSGRFLRPLISVVGVSKTTLPTFQEKILSTRQTENAAVLSRAGITKRKKK